MLGVFGRTPFAQRSMLVQIQRLDLFRYVNFYIQYMNWREQRIRGGKAEWAHSVVCASWI